VTVAKRSAPFARMSSRSLNRKNRSSQVRQMRLWRQMYYRLLARRPLRGGLKVKALRGWASQLGSSGVRRPSPTTQQTIELLGNYNDLALDILDAIRAASQSDGLIGGVLGRSRSA
jgi:hypothetical protein